MSAPPMRYAVLTLLACACVLSVQAQETDPSREAQTLNAGWRYAPGPIEGADAPAFDDSDWARGVSPAYLERERRLRRG